MRFYTLQVRHMQNYGACALLHLNIAYTVDDDDDNHNKNQLSNIISLEAKITNQFIRALDTIHMVFCVRTIYWEIFVEFDSPNIPAITIFL